MYEHHCLENIKKLCKNSGKHDDQQQYKATIGALMVSTPGRGNDNSTMPPSEPVTVKSIVQENHSVNFWKHWVSNIRLLSAG